MSNWNSKAVARKLASMERLLGASRFEQALIEDMAQMDLTERITTTEKKAWNKPTKLYRKRLCGHCNAVTNKNGDCSFCGLPE